MQYNRNSSKAGEIILMIDKLYDKCLRCSRKLKTEETRKRGYGDICWKKVNENKKVRLFDIAKSNT